MQREAPREIKKNISRARASIILHVISNYILSREIAKQWTSWIFAMQFMRLSSGHIDNKSLVDSQSKKLSSHSN